MTWIPVSQRALLHVTNAYDTPDGKIVLEGPAYDRASWATSWKWWIGAPGHPAVPVSGAIATRWLLDPATGTATEQELDDLVTDFPSINDDRTGRPSAISYSVAFPGAGLDEFAIVKLNTATGEDDGDLPANASQLLVLDAHDLSTTATADLPRRVPSGIHGSWIPDKHLTS